MVQSTHGLKAAGQQETTKPNVEIPIKLNLIDCFCLSVFVWSPCPPFLQLLSLSDMGCSITKDHCFLWWHVEQRQPQMTLKLHNAQIFTPVSEIKWMLLQHPGELKKGRCNMNYDRYFLHGPGTYMRKFALHIVWDDFWIMEKKHQKQHVVWTARFWVIADTFTASQGKMRTDAPPIF